MSSKLKRIIAIVLAVVMVGTLLLSTVLTLLFYS